MKTMDYLQQPQAIEDKVLSLSATSFAKTGLTTVLPALCTKPSSNV
jgi:hypothetical protein